MLVSTNYPFHKLLHSSCISAHTYEPEKVEDHYRKFLKLSLNCMKKRENIKIRSLSFSLSVFRIIENKFWTKSFTCF